MLDYLIVGAGPAGLQLGYFFEKSNYSYRILEAGESAGSFFEAFPRHHKLLSINKVHTGYDDPEINLRWDWNSLLSESADMLFSRYSKEYFPSREELRSYLIDFANNFKVKIEYQTEVVSIDKDDGGFTLTDAEQREHRARYLVIATGLRRPHIPPIPGIEMAEPYTSFDLDLESFSGQHVLIIGKGNSAFETADHLIPAASSIHIVSPKPLKMAWQSHFVGDLRAINNNFLDTYQLKSQNAVLDATIEKIERDGDRFRVQVSYTHAHGEREELIYDRLLACTGFRFDDSIFEASCRPDTCIDGRFPQLTSEWESTNVENLYFAGVLTQSRDYKKTTSAFIHGFRYNAKCLFHILGKKNHQISWPSRSLANHPLTIRDAIIDRVNRSSALWQQFGFLADLILIDEDGNHAFYYEELPLDYIHTSGLLEKADGRRLHGYIITLEYGSDSPPDPFNILRIERHDFDRADQSQFLHPIVRHFRGREQLAEHHIIEDLASEWREEVHTVPLLQFLERRTERARSIAAGA